MFIERLRVKGYKSLEDVTLADLSSINIFHGLNDVGKSNILEALDLFFQLLPLALELEAEWEGFTDFDLRPYSQTDIFRRQNDSPRIEWEARLQLPERATSLDVRLHLEKKEGEGLKDEHKWDLALIWPAGRPGEEIQRALRAPRAGFNLLTARRRFQAEYLEEETEEVERRTRRPQVVARNLKRALFDAYASLDLDERARFENLQKLLERHFSIGRLDVGLERPSRSSEDSKLVGREIIVRFLRSEGAITIKNVGSGARQALLILGQLLFNPARIAAIEEPEMNLNPDWQTGLLALLRDLIGAEAGQLDQLFISSHSPYIEFEDNFYLVTYENQATQIQRFPMSERGRAGLQGVQPLGERRLQRLNSQNQITLYQEVLDDLGLEYGDMVFLEKNSAGRWELWAEDEALAVLQEAWDDIKDN
jgi:predicted ATP-dependent endonuclease of OLD family